MVVWVGGVQSVDEVPNLNYMKMSICCCQWYLVRQWGTHLLGLGKLFGVDTIGCVVGRAGVFGSGEM